MEDSSTYHITINAPASHVLATLRDVTTYPDWQKEVAAVEVQGVDDRGLARDVTIVFTTMGMSTKLKLAVEHDDLAMRWSLVEGDFITRHDVEYTAVEQADGHTELSLRQELSFKLRLPDAFTRPMVERTITGTMAAVKRRAEQTVT